MNAPQPRQGCAAIKRSASSAVTAFEKEEALRVFTSKRLQVLELFNGLDPFGHDVHAEIVRERHDCADHLGSGRRRSG